MRATVVQLRSRYPASVIEARAGAPFTDQDIAIELQGDSDVFAPDGSLLCKLRRAAVSGEVSARAFPHLVHAAQTHASNNRGLYAGLPRVARPGSKQAPTVDPLTGKPVAIQSAVAGYFEPQGGRFPFCRATVFTADETDRWNEVLPLVHDVASIYLREVPRRYEVQRAYAEACSADFRIAGTPFSTLTINHNVAGSIHQDKGDLKEGFGVITCHRRGSYTGGRLGFPQYKVGVALEDRDVIFFNPHDWHGVTPIVSDDPDHARVSVVYYFRAALRRCGSAADELTRAKARGTLEDPHATAD